MFHVEWSEDSSATILGRITARTGSGAATGVAGEGNWLQVADVSAVLMKVFDLDGSTPNTPTNGAGAGEDLTVDANLILDTPVTTNVIWTVDTVGYNFILDLGPEYFPEGSRRYRIEFKVTLVGGAVFHGVFEGPANPITGN